MNKSKSKTPSSIYVAACDFNGVFRGKRIPVSEVDKALNGGIRLPLSTMSVNIWGADATDIPVETGDIDGLAEATERGLLPINWTTPPTAMVPVWIRNEDGSPYLVDTRRVLAEITQQFHAKGMRPVVATELEFYLTDYQDNQSPLPPVNPKTGVRLHKTSYQSLSELQGFSEFLDDVYRECDNLNIPADTAIVENGCGQFEINLLHTDDPLKAADDAVLFKHLVKGIAQKHGMTATFMAKPYGDESGNGLHVHCSVIDAEGNNLFDDGTDKGTPLLQHAVAGVLESMADFTLVFAPHYNSYRRLAPNSHAPTGVAWGYENRTAAIRIPGGPNAARRIEHRVAGADANPYLACAAILGGMLYGMERQLQPQPPSVGNVYADDSIALLPNNWYAAIERFESSDRVKAIFPAELVALFSAVKRQEAGRFAKEVTNFEYSTYIQEL